MKCQKCGEDLKLKHYNDESKICNGCKWLDKLFKDVIKGVFSERESIM